MKKSKEYAKEILDTYIEKNQADALTKAASIVKELFAECKEIEKQRKITAYPAMLNVLKEQHIKWLSISRKVNAEVILLNENAFLEVIEKKMTMIYPNLMAIIR